MNSNLGTHADQAVSSSALLGIFGFGPITSTIWWILFFAWLIVLILWIRAILKYNQGYRKYEESYRKYEQACCEYEQPFGQRPQELSLAQKSLGEFHQRHGMLLKFLCRLHLIVGYTDLQGRPSKLVHLGDIRLTCESVNEKLNVTSRCSQKPLPLFWRIYRKIRSIVWCHMPNDQAQRRERAANEQHLKQ